MDEQAALMKEEDQKAAADLDVLKPAEVVVHALQEVLPCVVASFHFLEDEAFLEVGVFLDDVGWKLVLSPLSEEASALQDSGKMEEAAVVVLLKKEAIVEM